MWYIAQIASRCPETDTCLWAAQVSSNLFCLCVCLFVCWCWLTRPIIFRDNLVARLYLHSAILVTNCYLGFSSASTIVNTCYYLSSCIELCMWRTKNISRSTFLYPTVFYHIIEYIYGFTTTDVLKKSCYYHTYVLTKTKKLLTKMIKYDQIATLFHGAY